MVRPKQNLIISWVLKTYGRLITRAHFKAINFNKVAGDQNKSVLLIANHFGWWDAFIIYHVNRLLFKKRFYVMLLEETTRRVPILKYGGAFSINKKSRDIIESLNYASQLLNEPGNIVLMFPQGKLCSNFNTTIKFEKGVLKLIEQAAGRFQLVFCATFIEYFQYKKPSAYVYITNADSDFTTIDELQFAYQQHYHAALLQQTQPDKQ